MKGIVDVQEKIMRSYAYAIAMIMRRERMSASGAYDTLSQLLQSWIIHLHMFLRINNIYCQYQLFYHKIYSVSEYFYICW